jgi:hypothetical protein
MCLDRMNTVPQCCSDFLGVAPSRTGSRFDTVEVRSSSLLVPTIIFIVIERIPENSRARDQPVIRRTTAEDGVISDAKGLQFKPCHVARLPLYSRENPSVAAPMATCSGKDEDVSRGL